MTDYYAIWRSPVIVSCCSKGNLTQWHIDNFWTYVYKQSGDKCWPWLGTYGEDDYGHVTIHNKVHPAHRIAYIITNGAIPDELDACHSCDFPPCCRPDHLFKGTRSENFQDSIRKGRRLPENYTHNNKIDMSIAERIRELYAAGNISQYTLAIMFGVQQPQISRIVNGKRW